MKKEMMKDKLLITTDEAKHLYELAYEHFQTGCYACHLVKKKLENFIGTTEMNRVKKTIAFHPYCSDNIEKLKKAKIEKNEKYSKKDKILSVRQSEKNESA